MPRRAIEINQRITRSEDAGEVCDLVETCAAEFDHVNVATAFRKLLQQRGGRDGASRSRVEPALRTLEQAAVRTIEDFQSQQVANTLHAMAKARYRPADPGVLAALDWRAEAVAPTMNAQDVTNTLWAYATMGRAPSAGVMRGLEGRAEAVAPTMKAQEVANTLWAACVFSALCAGEETILWVHTVASGLVVLGPASFNIVELSQLHQFFVWCSVHAEWREAARGDVRLLMDACRLAFARAPTKPSATQQQVSETLRGMGLSVKDEARCPTSGYSIDMLVADDAQGGAWAVEFDGPSHFLEIPSGSPRPTGATVLKRRLLQLLGHALVSVPYGEWGACKGAAEREQYLRGKLEALGR